MISHITLIGISSFGGCMVGLISARTLLWISLKDAKKEREGQQKAIRILVDSMATDVKSIKEILDKVRGVYHI